MLWLETSYPEFPKNDQYEDIMSDIQKRYIVGYFLNYRQAKM